METNFLAELHPKIVHFPIAFLSAYAVLEIITFVFKKEFVSKCAMLLLCIGVVFALLAVLSGNEAASVFQFWTEESTELLNEHQKYATFILWFSFFICALRLYFILKKKFTGVKRIIFLFFSVIILYLVFETSEHGGKLVSKFGIGTEIILQEKTSP